MIAEKLIEILEGKNYEGGTEINKSRGVLQRRRISPKLLRQKG